MSGCQGGCLSRHGHRIVGVVRRRPASHEGAKKKLEVDVNASRGYYTCSEDDIKVCEVLERLAVANEATLQDIALAYLFHQSTYVFPIVGIQTIEHVTSLPTATHIELSKEDIAGTHGAAPFNPLFPNILLFGQGYKTKLTATDQTHLPNVNVDRCTTETASLHATLVATA
ncbi:hypothetical protein K458DRAFT_405002 [Lentithecium fluviatile CBS 122367]|uniref:NADP-dependent oxidoreductase domain-containing protein n=1 Tax=Lentithecium fluviatile CBS 122367 TaxID=1168545 RepID=A0A6G1IYX1_9PLEO|nr:hypothetical protein K458DRAFT_405002 [Lentithecium fluviatile CBS 122367]